MSVLAPDLTACTALRTLALAPISLTAPAPARAYVPALLLVLLTLNARHLRHVRFVLRARNMQPCDMDGVDWARVADMHAGSHFGGLRRVTVDVSSGMGVTDVIVRDIEYRMPVLSKSGRVVIRFIQRV